MTTPAEGQNMRQLHSYTSLKASEKAEIDAPLWPQKRVDTTPGLSTAIFGDSFEDLKKKRADVDMWTIFSLLIIERRGVHISGGALGREPAGATKPRRAPLTARKLIWGSPFVVHVCVSYIITMPTLCL